MYESPCVPNKCYYSKMLLLIATLDQKECEIAYKKTTELLYNGFFCPICVHNQFSYCELWQFYTLFLC